jgi:putative transposase
MPQKKHTPEEIVAKLRQVDVLTSQGRSVGEAVRSIGVIQFTYYRWRKEFGGLKGDQVKRPDAYVFDRDDLMKLDFPLPAASTSRDPKSPSLK